MTSPIPPRYVVVSQSSLLPEENNSQPPSLIHPQIHYQYADDPPTAIPMSLSSEAQIIYMDFDSNDPSRTQVRSASDHLIATGVSVSDAVGALPIENSHLYIVNTGEIQPSNIDRSEPNLALREYRERLEAARRILEQNNGHPQSPVAHLKSGDNSVHR